MAASVSLCWGVRKWAWRRASDVRLASQNLQRYLPLVLSEGGVVDGGGGGGCSGFVWVLRSLFDGGGGRLSCSVVGLSYSVVGLAWWLWPLSGGGGGRVELGELVDAGDGAWTRSMFDLLLGDADGGVLSEDGRLEVEAVGDDAAVLWLWM